MNAYTVLLKKICAVSLLLGSVALLAWGLRSEANGPAARDFISYWSAGHLLVGHSNPYAADLVLEVEKAVGYSQSRALIVRNPPWALIFTLPLGLLNPFMGALVWILGLVACVMISVRQCWITQGRPANRLHLGIYLFAPTIACIITGQAGALMCVGVALYLRYRNEQPFAAGLGCALMMIKPHLFVPFWAVLMIDAARRRNFGIPAGILSGITLGAACALYFDPRVFQHYFQMTHSSGMQGEFIPVPATLFRLCVNRDGWVLQFVPVIGGLLWALWYYARSYREWDWKLGTPFLLFVSIFVAPYAWFTDEIVLAPTILSLVYALSDEGKEMWTKEIRVLVILDLLACLLIFFGITMVSGAYIWTSTAWFAWYLYSRRRFEEKLRQSKPLHAMA